MAAMAVVATGPTTPEMAAERCVPNWIPLSLPKIEINWIPRLLEIR